jgi:hypothetical protein
MSVEHRDEPAVLRQTDKQPLDVRARIDEPAVQPAFSRSADVTARSPTSRRSSAMNPVA